MFSHLAKKLKSNRGGAMVVSMIYFLFAAVVGTFVVSATNGSTYRLTRLREEAQSYHGAKSALNLVTNMFNKMSYTFELWERRATSDSNSELIYFVESIYPYKIDYKNRVEANKGSASTGNFKNKGKTYPVGKFTVNGDTSDENIKNFFDDLFSNHTVEMKQGDGFRNNLKDKTYGNDLANMFVTTNGTKQAYGDKILPNVDNGDNKPIIDSFLRMHPDVRKDNDRTYSDADLEGFYTRGATGDPKDLIDDIFKTLILRKGSVQSDNETNTVVTENIEINGNGTGNGTLQEKAIKKKQAGRNGLQLLEILENIRKSSASENTYTFMVTPDGSVNSVNTNLKPYYVTIKFMSDNKKGIGGTITADDLFVAVIEIREKETDATPLFTATSKCTVTATRDEFSDANNGNPTTKADGGTDTNSSKHAARTKITMQWNRWQNVNNTVRN